MTRETIIQGAIFAALGCTKIDYSSARKMDAAAAQIARFVEAALEEHAAKTTQESEQFIKIASDTLVPIL